MRTPDRLPDEALDQLLRGTPPQGLVGTPLASFVDAVRVDASASVPEASALLAAVLTDGLATEAPATDLSRSWLPTWTRSPKMITQAVLTKLAALSLLGKATAASAAVVVAASSAGAAGVLPAPAQAAFNKVVTSEADAGVDQDEVIDDEVTDDEVIDDGASEDENFGDRVSDDANGESDGEPGVDGREISSEASDGRSEVGRQRGEDASEGHRSGDDVTDEGDDADDEDADDEDADDADEDGHRTGPAGTPGEGPSSDARGR